MEISIIKLVPKDWSIKDLGKTLEIIYLSDRGNYNRKAFIFPKKTDINEELMEGIGLFLGDSDLNKKDEAHLTYASIDKDLAKRALNFLQKYFLLNLKDVTFTVQYKTSNENLAEEWSNFLKIPKEKILKRYSKRHKNECIQIQVNGIVFKRIFKLYVKEVLVRDFMKDENLRRAFLRGLFAAEGNIGIDYLENKPYISQITFSLHIEENKIKDYICNILKLENINYKINLRKDKNCLEICIFNWKNYLKFWDMKLFNLCKRKEDKFNEIASKLDIYLNINNKFRKEFFNSLDMYQKDIATMIGSWQANVCRTIEGKHLLRIEQIMSLLPYSKYNKNEIIKNTEEIRIGSLTKIEPNKDIIEFLKEFKLF